MKKIKFTFGMSLLLFLSTINAQNNGIGLGIILGEPTGFSFKNWMTSTSAIDAALAWSFVDGGAFHVHADYILHSFGLIKISEGKLPFYYGIGGRIKASDETLFGVRVPLGLDYLFRDAPVDIFLEVVPILDIIPKTDFRINAAVGARYFLN